MKRFTQILRGSGLLNIIGLTVAFAALYIIISQTYYDLTFNRRVNDADNIYLVTLRSNYEVGKQSIVLDRFYIPFMLENTAGVRAFGTSYFHPAPDANLHMLIDGTMTPSPVRAIRCDSGLVKTIGVQFLEGSLDALNRFNVIAISRSTATRYGIGIGDMFYSVDNAINAADADKPIEVKAIFADMPLNSHFGRIEGFTCYEFEKQPADPGEWSYVFLVKLENDADPRTVAATMFDKLKKQNNLDDLYTDMQVELTPTPSSISSLSSPWSYPFSAYSDSYASTPATAAKR